GWRNPPVPWSELEAALSDRARSATRPFPSQGDGGDSPAWSFHRAAYQAPAGLRPAQGRSRTPYAELHCHSNFSFLDGASHPEELVEEAVRLGLEALALTDHDGMYGVVRFAEAAAEVGLPTVFGAELSLGLTRPQNGVADPEGDHVLILARDPTGYTRLCRALSHAHLAGQEKGRPVIDLDTLAGVGKGSGTSGTDHWLVLTGCRKSSVPRALLDAGPAAAAAALAGLQERFGAANVAVELWDHGDPLDSVRNDALVALADRAGAEVVATNNVHYHHPARQRLAGALAAVRARRSLDDMDGWLPPGPSAHLRSGAEQSVWFRRFPGIVERAAEVGRACAFDLALVAPRLPPWPTPAGHSEMSWLRHLTEDGARRRYGERSAPDHPRAWAQIDYELDM
ncbi:MAG: PHP domain-containing protein, partial [Acidimicrobiales bacterium]